MKQSRATAEITSGFLLIRRQQKHRRQTDVTAALGRRKIPTTWSQMIEFCNTYATGGSRQHCFNWLCTNIRGASLYHWSDHINAVVVVVFIPLSSYTYGGEPLTVRQISQNFNTSQLQGKTHDWNSHCITGSCQREARLLCLLDILKGYLFARTLKG